jgi:hypothetical protein
MKLVERNRNAYMHTNVFSRVADPDPIWIRIQEGKNDPQKYKNVKVHVLKCWMFSFES